MVLSAAEDVQIICITETWLCCEILDAEVQIPNFTVFREDRELIIAGMGVPLSMFTTRCRQRGWTGSLDLSHWL